MIGRTLAHYKIVELLGKGGMGEVYRARDSKLGRDVALKILPEESAADQDRLARFEREARTVAGLSHPHIVTLHSVEEDTGTHFITMELVNGQTLDRMIVPGGLPLAKILDIGIAVADALAAAHENGVIHRDLKPGNIMLPRDGRVKLLDFGLSKLVETRDVGNEDTTVAGDLTRPGTAIGTLPYMSPEQLTGDAVDARTDVFSLGVVLYEMAAGRRPFVGNTSSEISAAILGADPAPLDQVRASTPRDLARVIRRCLAKSRDRRIQTARDVRNELEELQNRPASSPSSPGAVPEAEEAMHKDRFVITTAHVRQLTTRLPAMIGDAMPMIDNRRESDVLVFCLHGLGSDHTDFEELLRLAPYRVIAASMFGFAPGTLFRPELPLDDHNRLVALLLEHLRARIEPQHLVIAGHSSGCDQWGQILNAGLLGDPQPGGYIGLGPPFLSGPGIVSGPYSKLTDDPDDILAALRTVSAAAPNLDEWITMHEYLIRAFKKFRYDIAPLRRFAADIIESREHDKLFSDFRVICERVPVVRCVFGFDDIPDKDYALQRHIEDDLLGPRFDGEMFVDATVGHVELRRGSVTLEIIDSVVEKLRELST